MQSNTPVNKEKGREKLESWENSWKRRKEMHASERRPQSSTVREGSISKRKEIKPVNMEPTKEKLFEQNNWIRIRKSVEVIKNKF